MRLRLVALCLSVLGVGVLGAQEPTFDVVSVKLVSTSPRPTSGASAVATELSASVSSGFLPGGRYLVTYTNIQNLLGIAYRPAAFGSLGLDHIDITHVASWVRTSLFRIEARVSPAPAGWGNEDVGQPFLRSMLRDRFKLRAHFEKRDLPVYWMTVARADGTLGPNMRPNTAYDCSDVARLRRENPSELPPPNRQHPLCTVMMSNGVIVGGSVSTAVLAQSLRGPVGGPIVDHTGVTGAFDVDIHFTPQSQGVPTSDPRSAATIAQWPTLIPAIQEQLGLKLERHTEPQDVLVVDQIELPASD